MLEFSLTNKSVCSSESIKHVVGRPVTVNMIGYDNLKVLITQGYQCSIHLASGSENVTLRSIVYLIDKTTRKEKERKFLLKPEISGCFFKSNMIICATETCSMDKRTLRNENKAVACCNVPGRYNCCIKGESNSLSQ